VDRRHVSLHCASKREGTLRTCPCSQLDQMGASQGILLIGKVGTLLGSTRLTESASCRQGAGQCPYIRKRTSAQRNPRASSGSGSSGSVCCDLAKEGLHSRSPLGLVVRSLPSGEESIAIGSNVCPAARQCPHLPCSPHLQGGMQEGLLGRRHSCPTAAPAATAAVVWGICISEGVPGPRIHCRCCCLTSSHLM
jgi:hypothetical protein